MPTATTALLRRVFSDAQVIDIDMSRWDERVAFWVLADHYRNWVDRCPVVVVEFEAVTLLNFRFRHYSETALPKGRHYQWVVDRSSVLRQGGSWIVRLFANPRFPVTEIVSGKIRIREVSAKVVDRALPGWGLPYGPLARPGIEGIVRGRKSPRKG